MADRELPKFRPDLAIQLLNRYRVRYVLIGGFAANLQGSDSVTFDVDICYSRDADTLDSLSAALLEVHARLRRVHEEVPFHLDSQALRHGDTFTFDTDIGPVDILGTPAGTNGYDELARNAHTVDAFGETFLIASVDDLIRMKRAAGRPKDRVELEILGALREEIERLEDSNDR